MTTPRAFFVDDACFIFRSGCIVVVVVGERGGGEGRRGGVKKLD
jgi:hypothetical protein